MKGITVKTERGWEVRYDKKVLDTYRTIFLSLHPDDWWVEYLSEGMEVNFEKVTIRPDLQEGVTEVREVAKIVKEETWADIFEKCKYVTDSQSMTRGVIDWLSRNYKVPEQL